MTKLFYNKIKEKNFFFIASCIIWLFVLFIQILFFKQDYYIFATLLLSILLSISIFKLNFSQKENENLKITLFPINLNNLIIRHITYLWAIFCFLSMAFLPKYLCSFSFENKYLWYFLFVNACIGLMIPLSNPQEQFNLLKQSSLMRKQSVPFLLTQLLLIFAFCILAFFVFLTWGCFKNEWLLLFGAGAFTLLTFWLLSFFISIFSVFCRKK